MTLDINGGTQSSGVSSAARLNAVMTSLSLSLGARVSTRVSRSPTLAHVTRAPATVAVLQTLQLGEVSRGRHTGVIRRVQLLQQHKTFIPDTRGGVNIICVPCNHLDTYTWVNDLLRRRPR